MDTVLMDIFNSVWRNGNKWRKAPFDSNFSLARLEQMNK